MPVQNRRLPVEAWNPTSYKPTSKYVASGESLVAGSHLSQIFLVPSRLKQEPSLKNVVGKLSLLFKHVTPYIVHMNI